MRRPTANIRRGLTLIEMLLSMAIVGTITVACASVITLAARSTAGGAASSQATASPTTQAAAVRAAAEMVTTDLKAALNIVSQSATGVTFTVPDRLGAGSPQTVVYAWAGAGQPLTRQFNGAAAVALVTNVQNFNLTYLTKSSIPPAVESAVQVLASRDWQTAADVQAFAMVNDSAAEYFTPVLPSNAVSWKVTKVRLKLKRYSVATGNLVVHLSAVDASKNPTGASLATASVDVSTLSNAGWMYVDVPLTAVGGIAPGTTLSVVLLTPSATTLGYTAYDAKATDASMGSSHGNGSGTGFTVPTSTTAMEYYVYGTVTTQS